MSQSPHEHRSFTLDQADELATALIPRFREAIASDLSRVEHRLRRIEIEITRLKALSGLWGAVSGLLIAIGSRLLGK